MAAEGSVKSGAAITPCVSGVRCTLPAAAEAIVLVKMEKSGRQRVEGFRQSCLLWDMIYASVAELGNFRAALSI